MSSRPTAKEFQLRQFRQASRSKFRRVNSLDLIPEDPGQESQQEDNGHGDKKLQHASYVMQKQTHGRAVLRRSQSSHTLAHRAQQLIFFWPNLLLNVIITLVRYLLYIPFSIAAPSFWLSALLWIFWKFVRGPVLLVKWLLGVDTLAANASVPPNRTILISAGSTIQTLHLARNFYSSGARVVVFEFEGLFGLTRFSTAVDKFYVVPRPTNTNHERYIAALCHIVERERPQVYIPVCATSPAYYDALVKPHLELLGCATFLPGLQECAILDDCQLFYEKCAAHNIPLPPHKLLRSIAELHQLYESGFIANFRNVLMAVGMQGVLERYKYILPNRQQDLKFNHEISERQPWLIVRDQPCYQQYVTCTTVKDSRVIANATCSIEPRSKNLIPLLRNVQHTSEAANYDDETQIELWLRTFFAKVRFQRSINGYMSFRLLKTPNGQFLPLGVRLGVALPYICYSRTHATVLHQTMRCIHRRQDHDDMREYERESMLAALSNSWHTPEALDKCKALFTYWDPLPYCAYYHFQIPLESVKLFLQKRNRGKSLSTPANIAVPVH